MHKWTEDEISYLTELIVEYDFGCAEVTRKLNREFGLELSIAQIRNKIQSCGLYGEIHHNKYHKVLNKHITYLKENAKTHTCSELTRMLNEKFRTDFECECVRRILNSNEIEYRKRSIRTRVYNKEQLQFIEERKDNTYQKIIDDFYKEFGIQLWRGSISYVLKRYGIKRDNQRFYWTQEKKDFIKENSSTMSTQQLTDAMYYKFGDHLEPKQIQWELNKLGVRANNQYETDFAQTSFKMSDRMHELVKSMSSYLDISSARFMKDSFEWFIEADIEIPQFITVYLHKNENSKRKNYMQTIRIAQSLYDRVKDFSTTHHYKIGDVFLQSILSYSNYIESPSDSTKYDAENWV